MNKLNRIIKRTWKYGLFAVVLLIVAAVWLWRSTPNVATATWWNDNWSYRKAIVINHQYVEADLTDFPVLISFTDSNLSGHAQEDGDDFIFISQNGRRLAHEIEKYASSTGELVAWVKIPELSSADDTLIYLYYGNSAIGNQQSAINVWDENFVGVWHLPEDANASTTESINQITGIANGHASTTASGKINGAFQFDGSGDYIHYSSLPTINTPYTVEFWFYPKEINNEQVTIDIGGSNGRPRFILMTSNKLLALAGAEKYRYGSKTFAAGDLNKWWHVSFVVASSTDLDSWKIYLNGNDDSGTTGANTGNYYEPSSPGRFGLKTNDNSPLNGNLDEIRISSGERTSAWIKTSFTNQASTTLFLSPQAEETGPGPVGYWTFDTGYGTTAYDESGQGNDGTITGASWQSEDMCVSGKCLWFDGSDDEVTINNFDPPHQGTVVFWANPIFDGAKQRVLGGHDAFEVKFENNKFGCQLFAAGNAFVESTISIDENEWYFFACPYSYSSNQASLYINGSLDAASSTVTDDDPGGPFTLTIGNTTGAAAGDHFQGYLDEVKIYPYARSAEEIKQDYVAGLAGMKSTHGVAAAFGGESEKWMTDGLVGYWKMDESATTSGAFDASGNNNNGTYYGDASTTAGKFGNGGVFDGSGDYVNLGNPSSLNDLTEYTYTAWIKPDTVTPEYQGIMVKDGIFSTGGMYLFTSRLAGHRNYTTNVSSRSIVGDISAGEWQFVTMTYNEASDRKIYLYLNGQELSYTEQIPSEGTIASDAGSNLIISEQETANREFDGQIDEVRIYNRALSPREVRKLYEWAPGPVAHWRFDEMSGDTAYDSAASTTFSGGNHGTLTCNGAGCSNPAWTRGKYGSALEFDGTNFVDCENNGILNPGQFTYTAWIWKETDTTEERVFVDHGSLRHFSVQGGPLRFETTDSGDVNGNTVIQPHTWYHAVTTYDGAQAILYLNGVVDGTKSGLISPGSGNMKIGSCPCGSHHFHGLIDDVRIYNYALNQKQIINVMSARGGSAFGGNGPVDSEATVLHLKFDKGTGATAYDSSLQGNNGTLNHGSSGGNDSYADMWDLNGKFGRAMEFDGDDDYVDCGDTSSLSITGDLTLSAWVFPGREPYISGQHIIDKYSYPSNQRAYKIDIDATGGNCEGYLTFIVSATAGSFDGAVLCSDIQLSAGNWYHVVAKFDAGNSMEIYIDGINHTGEIVIGSVPASIADSTSEFAIGADGNGAGPLDGLIDDVRIYNFALTEDEIKLIYNQGKSAVMGSIGGPPSSDGAATSSWAASLEYCVPGSDDYCVPPVGEWRFDELTGTTTYDKSGEGNDGVFVSSATSPTWRGAGCKIGNCLEFDGSNDYVDCGSDSSLDPGGSNWTIAGWFKTDSSSNEGYIVYKDNSTDDDRIHIGVGDGTEGNKGKVRFAYSTGAGVFPSVVYDTDIMTSNAYNNGDWHYFAGVRTGYRTGDLYIDGILAVQDTDNSGSLTSIQTTRILAIGADSGGGINFDGLIDHVRIYNYARTPAQIAWDYNQGKAIAHWRFDECKGGVIYDQSDRCINGVGCNHGTLQLGTGGDQTATGTCASSSASSFWWNGRNGHINSAGSFDGDSDYVDCGNDTSLVLHDKDFTIAAWAKLSSKGSDREIIGKLPLDGLKGIELRYDVGDDYWELSAHDGAWQHAKYSQENPNLNEWYHVVGQYLMDEEVIRIYVNGVLGAITDTINLGITDVSANKLMIGCQGEDTDDRLFDGLIDEVKIFNYALTEEQVKTEYNNGAVSFGN